MLSDADRAAGWIEWKQGDPPHPLYVATAGENQRAAAALATTGETGGVAEAAISPPCLTDNVAKPATTSQDLHTAARPSETPRVKATLQAGVAYPTVLLALAGELEREVAALRRELQQLAHERDGILEKLIAAEQRAKDAGGGNG